jgi:hypothetical protein
MFFSLPQASSIPIYQRDFVAKHILLSRSDQLSLLSKTYDVNEDTASSSSSQPPGGESSSLLSSVSSGGLKVSFSSNEQTLLPDTQSLKLLTHIDSYPRKKRKTPRERREDCEPRFSLAKREFEHLIFPSIQKTLPIEKFSRKIIFLHPSDVYLFEIGNEVSRCMLLAAHGVGSKLFYIDRDNTGIKFISSSIDSLFEKYFGSDALKQSSFLYMSHIKAYISYCKHAAFIGNLYLELDNYTKEMSSILHNPTHYSPIFSETDHAAGCELSFQLRTLARGLLETLQVFSSKDYMNGILSSSSQKRIHVTPFQIFLDLKVVLRILQTLKSGFLNLKTKHLYKGNNLFLNLYLSIPPSLQALRLFKATLNPLLRVLSRQLGYFVQTSNSVYQNEELKNKSFNEIELNSIIIMSQGTNNDGKDLSYYSLEELPDFFTDEELGLTLASIKRCAETVKLIRNNSIDLASIVCPYKSLSSELNVFRNVRTCTDILLLHDIVNVQDVVLKARREKLNVWKLNQRFYHPSDSQTLSNNHTSIGVIMSSILDRFALSSAEQLLRNTLFVRERKTRIAKELEDARVAAIKLKEKEFERISLEIEETLKQRKALRLQKETEEKELVRALAASDKALANPIRGAAWDGSIEKAALYAEARIELLKKFGDKVKAFSLQPNDRITDDGTLSTDEATLVALDALSALGASGIRQASILAQQLNISYPKDQNRRRAVAPNDSLNIFQEEQIEKVKEDEEVEKDVVIFDKDDAKEEEEEDVEEENVSNPTISVPVDINEGVTGLEEEPVIALDSNSTVSKPLLVKQEEQVSTVVFTGKEGGTKLKEKKKYKTKMKKTTRTELVQSHHPRRLSTVGLSTDDELNSLWGGFDPALQPILSSSILSASSTCESSFALSLQTRFLGASDLINKNNTSIDIDSNSFPSDTRISQQACSLRLVLRNGLLSPLIRHISLIDEAGAALVRTQGNLLSHYKKLHEWMLLGSGHSASKFVDDLIASSMFKISVSVSLDSFSRTDDTIVFDRARARAVSLANNAFERVQSNLGEEIQHSKAFKYKLASLATRVNLKKKIPFDGMNWWSSTALDLVMSPTYEVKLGELESLILTPSTLSVFENIHMFLLGLRRTRALLSTSWLLMRSFKKIKSGIEQALYLFSFDAVIALNALDKFVFLEVIETSFKVLQRDTDNATSIAEIKNTLSRFLNTCMLSDNHVILINSIQDIILNVCSIIEGMNESTQPSSQLRERIETNHKALRRTLNAIPNFV